MIDFIISRHLMHLRIYFLARSSQDIKIRNHDIFFYISGVVHSLNQVPNQSEEILASSIWVDPLRFQTLWLHKCHLFVLCTPKFSRPMSPLMIKFSNLCKVDWYLFSCLVSTTILLFVYFNGWWKLWWNWLVFVRFCYIFILSISITNKSWLSSNSFFSLVISSACSDWLVLSRALSLMKLFIVLKHVSSLSKAFWCTFMNYLSKLIRSTFFVLFQNLGDQ